MIRKRQKSLGAHVEGDLEIMPLMNLFVVLIPMLLISAVFIQVSVIKMNLPSDEATPPSERERLGLAVEITDAAWIVKGRRLDTVRIDRAVETSGQELLAALAGVKSGHPDEDGLVIESQEATRYEDIVYVMDVSREAGLPNVSLAGS
jgi:biopolymer transport protein ExbD